MFDKYKLVGFINLFGIIPDFVYPVFECKGECYFQHGNNDRIEEFEKVKSDLCQQIIPLIGSKSTTIDLSSNPIYAFQSEEENIYYGHTPDMKKYLATIKTDDSILSKEIHDFFIEVGAQMKSQYTPAKKYYYGTGRRKSSVARVRIYEDGTGAIVINGRDINDYFGMETLKLIVNQPLVITNLVGRVNIVATVAGGGVSGQAGAIRHGISRALVTLNSEYRPSLKAAGLMTRDSRKKERKKYGLKAARRASQFSKR